MIFSRSSLKIFTGVGWFPHWAVYRTHWALPVKRVPATQQHFYHQHERTPSRWTSRGNDVKSNYGDEGHKECHCQGVAKEKGEGHGPVLAAHGWSGGLRDAGSLFKNRKHKSLRLPTHLLAHRNEKGEEWRKKGKKNRLKNKVYLNPCDCLNSLLAPSDSQAHECCILNIEVQEAEHAVSLSHTHTSRLSVEGKDGGKIFI